MAPTTSEDQHRGGIHRSEQEQAEGYAKGQGTPAADAADDSLIKLILETLNQHAEALHIITQRVLALDEQLKEVRRKASTTDSGGNGRSSVGILAATRPKQTPVAVSAILRPEQTRPIFIHGYWRTGSTYIWAKFREQENCYSYCEPLHDYFTKVRKEDLARTFSANAIRELRHPSLKTFYFLEYPFLPQGGVEKFRKHFSYEHYCLDEDDSDVDLREYVSHLIALAVKKNKRPVLQFNRALLRSRWLKKQFSPVSILLLRSPIDTWKSICSFSHGYFKDVTSCIIGQNGIHKWFLPLREKFRIPRYLGSTFQDTRDYYHRFTQDNEQNLYFMFYYLYILTFLYNIADCDVVMDMNLLSQSSEMRDLVIQQMRAYDIDISLSDCTIPSYKEVSSEEQARKEIEHAVISLLKEHFMTELKLPGAIADTRTTCLSKHFEEIIKTFTE